jgi:acyl carrier protein
MESDAIDATSTPDSLANWDSFAHLQLVLSLEKKFGIRMTPKDVMQLRSIGHAVDIVARHNDAKGG